MRASLTHALSVHRRRRFCYASWDTVRERYAVNRSMYWALAAASALAPPSGALAATPHWPLPADSLARNGTPQTFTSHKLTMHALPPLPDTGPSPNAAAGLKRRYSGTPIDVLNYHYDNYPTGWNRSETDLTPATVASSSFAQLTTLNVDGNVFAQPLMVSNVTLGDGSTHNILIVATGHNTVYAYDAQNYAILWQVSLGKSQSSNDVGCGDVEPEYGISSTPVIVRNGNGGTIYIVSATEPASMSFHTQLHALDLLTGADTIKPREIDPQTKLKTGGTLHFDPQNQWGRTSLVYANGAVYVGIGSHCDHNAGSISGWLLRYDTSTLKLAGKFNTIKASAGYELASIWMSGYAPAIDDAGDVLAITGNGNFSLTKGSEGYGESIIAVAPDMKTLHGTFTPSDWQSLNNSDSDFGSGGVMAIPVVQGQASPPLAIGAGKDGNAYLVNTSKLGGKSKNGSTPLQTLSLAGCFCAPAYYATASGGVLFYQTSSDVLRAYSVGTTATPVLTQIAAGTDQAGFGGSFPIVSTNGSAANTGVVWALERGSTMQLKAYNAASLGAPLFQANSGTWSNGSRGWLTPLVANGRVYAPAAGTVTVFGLTN